MRRPLRIAAVFSQRRSRRPGESGTSDSKGSSDGRSSPGSAPLPWTDLRPVPERPREHCRVRVMQRCGDFGQWKFRVLQQPPRKFEARSIEKLLQARPIGAQPLPQCLANRDGVDATAFGVVRSLPGPGPVIAPIWRSRRVGRPIPGGATCDRIAEGVIALAKMRPETPDRNDGIGLQSARSTPCRICKVATRKNC